MALSQNPQDDPPGTKYSAPIPLDSPAPAAAQPQASPAPANAQSPSADPLAGVMAQIAQPESGGRNVLYGGAPVPPGNVIPGALGPTGQQTHAFSKYQFEPATWNDAAAAARAQGYVLNKDNPQDIEWAGRYTARRAYGVDQNGRNLDQAAAAGAVDKSRLAKTWPSLGYPGGSPASEAAAEKVRADKYTEAADLRKQAQAAIDQIKSMGGDISKAMERVRAAQDKAEQAQEATLEAIKKPPQLPVLDSIQKIGGLATVVGILGGLMTKSPMRASINGMAAALEAYNSGDQQAYRQAYNDWKTQTDMLAGIAKMQSDNVRNILYDEDMGLNERKVMLDTTLRAMQQFELADQAKTGGDQVVLDWYEKLDKGREELAKHQQLVQDRKDFEEWKRSNPSKGGAPARFGTVDDLMNRWHSDFVEKNKREPTTDEIANQRAELAQQAKPPGAVSMVQTRRLELGGNEVAKAVTAMTQLPAGTTLGLFGGAQAALGPDLAENIKKNLANTVTPQSAQILRTLSNGVSRGLATLLSSGAAQGVQQFSEQLKSDLPQAGDTGIEIAAKYADIRQIVQAATEVMVNDDTIPKSARAMFQKISDQVEKVIPFTTGDISKLVTDPSDANITQFAAKIGLGLPEGIPPGSTRVGLKNGNPVYKAPDGGLYMVH